MFLVPKAEGVDASSVVGVVVCFISSIGHAQGLFQTQAWCQTGAADGGLAKSDLACKDVVDDHGKARLW